MERGVSRRGGGKGRKMGAVGDDLMPVRYDSTRDLEKEQACDDVRVKTSI